MTKFLWAVIWNPLIVVRGIVHKWTKLKVSKIGVKGRKSCLHIICFKMGRMKDIYRSQVAAIKALRDSAMSQKDIVLQMGCSQSAMSKILAKEESIRKNWGKKIKTTSRDERVLKRITTQTRFLSSNEICQLVESIWWPGFPVHHSLWLHSLGCQKNFLWPSYFSTPSRKVWIGSELIMDGLLSS